MPIRVNQTSSKLWQDRCGLLLDGLTAPGAGGLPGAGGNAAAVAIELASEKKVFSLPAKCRSRRRKLNKSLTNTEGFQRLARCIFIATSSLLLSHTAGLDTIFIKMYIDAPPGLIILMCFFAN